MNRHFFLMCAWICTTQQVFSANTTPIKFPLHYAAHQGDLEACNMLLEQYKFDVNQTDETNCTPLGCAVSMIATREWGEERYSRLIDRLLKLGADIESPVQSGKTPLCVVLGSSFTCGLVIRQLLNHGASLPDKECLQGCNSNTITKLASYIKTARNWRQSVQTYLRSKKVPSELPEDIVQMIIKFATNTMPSDPIMKEVADEKESDDEMLPEARRQVQEVTQRDTTQDKNGCCTIL